MGTQGVKTILDGSVQTADIANNAITQAKLSTDVPLSGMRNSLINGAMEVWQRGTDTGAITGNTKQFQADRWWHQGQGSQNSSVSRSTDAPSGFRYSARVRRNSGSVTGPIYFAQDIETVNSIYFAGKQATVSFWAKAGANFSSTSNALTVNLASGTGTDQTRYGSDFTGVASVINQTVTLTTSWQRFSLTGSVNSNATQLGLFFSFNATGTASTDDSFYITGVQLEVGSQATPFEQRIFGAELQLCQRYYSRIQEAGFNRLGVVSGDPTHREAPFFFPVQMRAAPTVTITGGTVFIFSTYVAQGASTTNALGVTTRGGYQQSTGFSSATTGATCAFDNFNIVASVEL